MKITKTNALTLMKILSHYTTVMDYDHRVHGGHGICSDLENFLLGEDEDEDTNEQDEEEEEECSDEEIDCEEDEEESVVKEDDPSCEADDLGEEDDCDCGNCETGCYHSLDADATVDGGDLHYLSQIRAKVIASANAEKDEVFTLEFECESEDGATDLLLNDDSNILWICSLSYVKRTGKELHVCEKSGEWHRYSVSKFPKDWQNALEAGVLHEITSPT